MMFCFTSLSPTSIQGRKFVCTFCRLRARSLPSALALARLCVHVHRVGPSGAHSLCVMTGLHVRVPRQVPRPELSNLFVLVSCICGSGAPLRS